LEGVLLDVVGLGVDVSMVLLVVFVVAAVAVVVVGVMLDVTRANEYDCEEIGLDVVPEHVS